MPRPDLLSPGLIRIPYTFHLTPYYLSLTNKKHSKELKNINSINMEIDISFILLTDLMIT